MLKGINPILGPEILYTIRSMGHGGKLALVDSNFPSGSLIYNNTNIRIKTIWLFHYYKRSYFTGWMCMG